MADKLKFKVRYIWLIACCIALCLGGTLMVACKQKEEPLPEIEQERLQVVEDRQYSLVLSAHSTQTFELRPAYPGYYGITTDEKEQSGVKCYLYPAEEEMGSVLQPSEYVKLSKEQIYYFDVENTTDSEMRYSFRLGLQTITYAGVGLELNWEESIFYRYVHENAVSLNRLYITSPNTSRREYVVVQSIIPINDEEPIYLANSADFHYAFQVNTTYILEIKNNYLSKYTGCLVFLDPQVEFKQELIPTEQWQYISYNPRDVVHGNILVFDAYHDIRISGGVPIELKVYTKHMTPIKYEKIEMDRDVCYRIYIGPGDTYIAIRSTANEQGEPIGIEVESMYGSTAD